MEEGKSEEKKRDSQTGKNQTLKTLLQTALLSGWAIKKGPKAWVRDHTKWLTFVNHCLFWSSDETNENITGKYRFLRETIFIERVGKTALRFRGSDFKDRVFDFTKEKRADQWYNRCQKSIDIRLEVGFQFDKKGTVVDRFKCSLFFVDSNKKWKDPLDARVSIVTYKERGEIDIALLMDIFKKNSKSKVVDSKKRFLARRGLTPKNPNAWVLRGQDMDLRFNESVFCVKMSGENDRRLFQESFISSWGNLDRYQPEGRVSVFDEGKDEGDEEKGDDGVVSRAVNREPKKKKGIFRKKLKPIDRPVQNELDGEVSQHNEGVVQEQFVQWACAICTYLNEPNHLSCAMCATQRAGNKKPKAQAQQPKPRAEQPKAQSVKFNARSEQPKARSEQLKARSVVNQSRLGQQYALPAEYKSNSEQRIARSDQQFSEPVASSRFVNNAEVDSQRIVQQTNDGEIGNVNNNSPNNEPKSEVPRNLAGLDQAMVKLGQAVRDSESDNGSLEELYDQKEGENVVEVSPPNRRHLSVYSGNVGKDEEVEWSSFEDESFEEEMTADFQRRIIAQTVTALKIKGGASCLSTLVEIVSNLRYEDARYRVIVTTGRKFKTRSFFIHKEAVGAIEAIGFVPVGSQNEVFAWDPEFSALTVDEIIEAVDKPRKSNLNVRSEMSFMTVDTEEINAIHDVFGDEDPRPEGGVQIMSE